MLSGLFLDFAIITFPILLYQLLFFHKSFEYTAKKQWLLGLYGGLSGAACEWLPVMVAGAATDFKSIPVLLSILYGGRRAGLIALSIVVVLRGFTGHSGVVLALLSMMAYSIPAFLLIRRFAVMNRFRRMVLIVCLSVATVMIQMVFTATYVAIGSNLSKFFMYLTTDHMWIWVTGIQCIAILLCAFIIENIIENDRIRIEVLSSQYELKRTHKIARIGAWQWYAESNQISYADEVYEMLGFSRKGLGHSYTEFLKYVHPDDYHLAIETFQKCMSSTRYQDVEAEFRVLSPQRTVIFLHVRAKVHTNQQGRVFRVLGTVQDITARVEADQQLKESEQRYKSLVKYNSTGICSFDLNGKIVSANAAYEVITGYPEAELIGKSRLDLWFEEDHELAGEVLAAMQQGVPWEEFNIALRHKDGHAIEVSCTTVPIVVNQKTVGFYGIVKDLTESKRSEELIRRTEKLSVIGQLAAGVAHEIRNPLTSLKGFIQLFSHFVPTEKQHIADIMMQELSRIDLISSELLVLAKPQASGLRTCNIQEVYQHVAMLLTPQAILHNIEFQTHFLGDIPDILCDENQMKQVFINILKNAIDAMPDGGEIRTVGTCEGDELVIQIQDTGMGIPEEVLKKLGEPFYTTKEKGTGLGVMVTHRLIERHNGRIDYESQEGIGTTVRISLPISARMGVASVSRKQG